MVGCESSRACWAHQLKRDAKAPCDGSIEHAEGEERRRATRAAYEADKAGMLGRRVATLPRGVGHQFEEEHVEGEEAILLGVGVRCLGGDHTQAGHAASRG